MTKAELIDELREHILAELPLEGVTAGDITPETLLFDPDGLALDSLDAVELVVMLDKYYGVTIADADQAKELFATLNSLSDFILSHSDGVK